ncbi:hypothetical protein [Sulfurospirillum sp. hDNRA2]|uniref:hypothetical protein n=1 Tax=Sulfurospirillum sp. hDNRA2 TaxID=3237298 RepID=UPI0020B777B0|nr:hypothetical protein [Sulfurospirillum sp. DNRA8]MCP3653240.1 hypothetical protein [Sulfurospirillum sp. DNRA8]MCR1812091.1 hypothetical protein [Sulfurospirillum sp. DNRA8]
MKNSLLVLTALVVLMSGCAQKGTITLYGQDEKVVDSLETILFLDDKAISKCEDEEENIVVEIGYYDIRFNVPIALNKHINADTNETNTTIDYGKLQDGSKTILKACFLDNTRKEIRLTYTKKEISVKPLASFEDENIGRQ